MAKPSPFASGVRRQWAVNRLLAAKWAVSEEEENLSHARLQLTLVKDIIQAAFGNLVASLADVRTHLPDQSSRSDVEHFTTSVLEQHGQFLLNLQQAVADRLLPSPEPALAGKPENLSDSGGYSERPLPASLYLSRRRSGGC